MAKLLTAFIPEISFLVRGCPSVVITNSVRLAAQRFCEESRFWRVDVSADVIAGTAGVALGLPATSIAVAPVWLRYAGVDLTIATDVMTRESRAGKPAYAYLEDNTVNLSPVPSESLTAGLTGRVAIKPTAVASEIDDRIVNHYNDALVWGAMAELLAMSGFEWYDQPKSNYYEARFREAVAKARQKASGADGPVVRIAKYGGY